MSKDMGDHMEQLIKLAQKLSADDVAQGVWLLFCSAACLVKYKGQYLELAREAFENVRPSHRSRSARIEEANANAARRKQR